MAAFLLALAASGCAGFQRFPLVHSQRWPAPMRSPRGELPPGDASLHPAGPEEVRVIRHADPVQVRVAGSAGHIPLSYRRKEMRVPSGSGVVGSEEGRAEVLWSTGSSVVLYGRCDAIIGSPSRGEPSLMFRSIDQVRFDPASEDLYELPGGAKLRCSDGPVRANQKRRDILRVANESKGPVQVAFLQETIVLDPGQAVEVPILSLASQPAARPERMTVARGQGFSLEHAEGTEVTADAGALLARGAGDVFALGVRVALAAGTEARFLGLARPVDPGAGAGPR